MKREDVSEFVVPIVIGLLAITVAGIAIPLSQNEADLVAHASSYKADVISLLVSRKVLAVASCLIGSMATLLWTRWSHKREARTTISALPQLTNEQKVVDDMLYSVKDIRDLLLEQGVFKAGPASGTMAKIKTADPIWHDSRCYDKRKDFLQVVRDAFNAREANSKSDSLHGGDFTDEQRRSYTPQLNHRYKALHDALKERREQSFL